MKIICFDLDGVLCTNTFGDYEKAIPIKKAILKANFLYNKGYVIKIFTARFMGKNNEIINKAYEEGYEFTKTQLATWGIKYHELIMGKPTYDIIIDDKQFGYNEDWITKIEKIL